MRKNNYNKSKRKENYYIDTQRKHLPDNFITTLCMLFPDFFFVGIQGATI